jgi:hypothetical protein
LSFVVDSHQTPPQQQIVFPLLADTVAKLLKYRAANFPHKRRSERQSQAVVVSDTMEHRL